MTNQPDIQARYLASILDLLADETSNGVGDPRIRSLASNAAHLARQLADSLGSSASPALPQTACEGSVIPFRRRG